MIGRVIFVKHTVYMYRYTLWPMKNPLVFFAVSLSQICVNISKIAATSGCIFVTIYMFLKISHQV